MKEIFAQRRFHFVQQCLSYLRYVFNDHFVLALLLLAGFVMVEYSKLLQNFPREHLPLVLLLGLLFLVLVSLGRVATYLEPADKQFFLIREGEIRQVIKKSLARAILVWGSIQTLVFLLISPILLALGLPDWGQGLLLVLLWLVKGLVLTYKIAPFYGKSRLDWGRAVAYEQARKQAILKFFALFTNVKGISSKVKRRVYLDKLLGLFPKTSQWLWGNLYWRAFLRSGDYLGLTGRLVSLSLLSLLFVGNRLMAEGLALLLIYLWLFQLLALGKHYDYQYLTQLYPSHQQQAVNLLALLRRLLGLALFLQLPFLVFKGTSGVLLVGSLVLFFLYLPSKVRFD